MKKFRFLVSIFLSVIAFSSFVNAGSGYHDEAAEAVHMVHDILIANNICQITKASPQGYKYNNCHKKELVFSYAGYDGFGISTYGITDKKVLQQIVSLLKSEYIRYDGKVSIGFTAIRGTWQEERAKSIFLGLSEFFTKKNILMKVKFERKEK